MGLFVDVVRVGEVVVVGVGIVIVVVDFLGNVVVKCFGVY